jgi:hypothetical protein
LPAIDLDLRELMDVHFQVSNVDALLGVPHHVDEISPDPKPLLLV